MRRYLGVDIGTSSSKGVLVDEQGTILASESRPHTVSRPNPGHVEMPASEWWQAFVELSSSLTGHGTITVDAVGVSGMGPCLALATEDGAPTRDAILYGVDTRATEQIESITHELEADEIVRRCGSSLSSQAVGPKIRWVLENEPDTYRRSQRFFMPSSWLVWNLTGQYVLDHHSASQCAPLYDLEASAWNHEWAERIAPAIELPKLEWSESVAGHITEQAARLTGIPTGTPVTVGTIDAWAEASSVGADQPGDLMLMYGTTMFLIATTHDRHVAPPLWSTNGVRPFSPSLSGGMATSGAVLEWLRSLTGDAPHAVLDAEARSSGAGASGLLMLPYFAGERTPIDDPRARGVVAGLTVSHTRGDLYRAALEAVAFGVRHHLEHFAEAGASIDRALAVGGGAGGALWPQIVSDVTGLDQHLCAETIGASYGSARLAASMLGADSTSAWNPTTTVVRASSRRDVYDERYDLYRELYSRTRSIVHALDG